MLSDRSTWAVARFGDGRSAAPEMIGGEGISLSLREEERAGVKVGTYRRATVS